MAVEGGSYTNLLNLIKSHGYNKDNHVVMGKVSSISPLTVQLDGFSIKAGQFFIAERLTEHTRDINIHAATINPTATPFDITEGTMTIKSPLKAGDFVIVLIDENDFFIIDKVVS